MSIEESVKVAVISVTATPDKESNIRNAFIRASEAVAGGANWICLPEMFSFHGPYAELWKNAEFENGPLNQKLSEFAQRHKVVIFAGSAGERPQGSTDGKVYNTQYVFGKNGEILTKYRKIHLFNLKDQDGKALYCESDGYLAGNELVTLSIDGWAVGLATCYDLRFPEMFSALARSKPLDCLVIPAAFTLQTGMSHWELLLRARAVENLCYVAAANQVGTHSPGKQSYGHAILVDPWGTVVADSGHIPGVAQAEISKSRIQICRSQLPAIDNRRPEIYS